MTIPCSDALTSHMFGMLKKTGKRELNVAETTANDSSDNPDADRSTKFDQLSNECPRNDPVARCRLGSDRKAHICHHFTPRLMLANSRRLVMRSRKLVALLDVSRGPHPTARRSTPQQAVNGGFVHIDTQLRSLSASQSKNSTESLIDRRIFANTHDRFCKGAR